MFTLFMRRDNLRTARNSAGGLSRPGRSTPSNVWGKMGAGPLLNIFQFGGGLQSSRRHRRGRWQMFHIRRGRDSGLRRSGHGGGCGQGALHGRLTNGDFKSKGGKIARGAHISIGNIRMW